ncbi:MAG: propionyl-CoA carboxylase beta chain, partial [Frankiaceae bacterium]|nr:propionyl-CoA carboxylase beta chain [Frankiaceae bacterium]
NMFITGPDVIKTVTGEDVAMEDLGGGRAHNTKSGVAHHLAADEADALTDTDLELDTVVPDSPNTPYDIHEVITRVLDDGEFLEVQALWAQNILTGYGRVDGRPVGIVANQPMQFAGTLNIDASEKASRFVRTCDAFNIPVLTFVDVPGFLPGTDQEWQGIIRRGAKLIYAYCEATVPKITVITRKAYGGAYDVMGSKHLRSDISFAWPTAEIAVMGAQGAANIIHRRTLATAGKEGKDVESMRKELIDDYADHFANPFIAAERGYIDSVIEPSQTRREIIKALRLLKNKRESLPPKKHGNIPL